MQNADPRGAPGRRKNLPLRVWLLIIALFAVTMACIRPVTLALMRNFAPASYAARTLNDYDLMNKAGFNPSLLPVLLARAQAGDRTAMYFYGEIFDPNEFTSETVEPKNAAVANAWFRRAVALDDQGAERSLGINYYYGTGVAKDDKMAAALLERAAAKNDDYGDYYLGLMLENGEGEPANLPRALALEQAAAAQNLDLAQVQLGLMYSTGAGAHKDPEKAKVEWRLAAAQGNQDAQRYLDEGAGPVQNSTQKGCGDRFSMVPSPALLIRTHDCLAAGYDPSKPLGNSAIANMIWTLEAAGVKSLLTGPGGIPAAERVAILEDYGVWTYRLTVNDPRIPTEDPDCHCPGYGPGATPAYVEQALTALKLVVRLAPNRASGWQGLGNLYASMLNPKFIGPDLNATWKGKVQLTRQALDAYAHYLALTPLPAQYAKDFLTLNVTNAPSGDVCQFVAAFVNEDRLDEVFSFATDIHGTPVDLFGDGKPYYIYMGRPQNGDGHRFWGSYLFVTAFTTPQKIDYSWFSYGLPSQPGSVDFSPLGLSDTPPYFGDIRLMAYNNFYYILAINYSTANNAVSPPPPPYGREPVASVTVIQPNHGVICHVTPHITPRLAFGQGNPLCDQFFHGADLPQPPKILPSPADLHKGAPLILAWQIPSAIYNVDLENNGHVQTVANVPPGLTLYDPKAYAVIDSPLTDTLQSIPHGGGDEHLITYDGKIYIETIHEKQTLPGEAKGAGIYEVHNDKILPVCLVGNEFTYTTK